MKIKWTLAAAILLLLCIFFITALRSTPERHLPATLTFAGFTNAPGGTEALFWFTNLHRGYLELDHGWSSELDVSRWTSSGWADEGRVMPSQYSSPAYGGRELIGVPVKTTNVPLRVTLHYQELNNRIERIRTRWYEIRDKTEYSREHEHWVNGETVAAGVSP